MGATLGEVIFASVKPIFKIYLIIGVGFMLARYGILGVEATRIISDIVLTVLIPCLAFSKIVSNIEDQDIKQVGIICLSAVLIFGTGLFMAFMVRSVLPVPKRWRGGILAGGMFPNISDLPIAYLQSMDNGLIFTKEEGDKGVASVIIFMTMFMLCVFNLGGFRLIEMDFRYNDIENADQESTDGHELEKETSKELGDNANDEHSGKNESVTELQKGAKKQSTDTTVNNILTGGSSSVEEGEVLNRVDTNYTRSDMASIPSTYSMSINDSLRESQHNPINHSIQVFSRTDTNNSSLRHRGVNGVERIRSIDLREMPAENMNDLIKEYSNVDQFGHIRENPYFSSPDVPETIRERTETNTGLSRILTSDATVTTKDIKNAANFLPNKIKKIPIMPALAFFLKNCLRPASMAVIISLIIAFIPWVKALFVTTKHTPKIRQAPDGQPILNFMIDFTSYVGSAAVPFGLMLLGATLGRLKIGKLYPGFWKAAVTLVVLRQCVMPIFGVLWCDRLVKAGWLNWESDRMLLFVIAIDWALPTMTTLIYFTASYTPIDCADPIQMECVSFFLMIQYPLLVVSLPFLVTYFLKVQIKV
ncbi:putative transporter [Nakaseomyces bracarensis]|uniref:Transporter n=1 Tax=Nakaseomyces bracarensis TaxID=273131 RepID=A0ABR4NMN8_9SACH